MVTAAERQWSVGELAAASGLTVRALHHYDQIGLLSASVRTGAGHRRYTVDDVRRLYRIRALRQLGLSLDDIGAALSRTPDDAAAWRALLAAQLDHLASEAARTQQLMTQVRGLLAELDDTPPPQSFLTVLEAMSMYETYFDQDQRDQLANRRDALGAPAVEDAKREFAGLVTELQQHRTVGTPVDDPVVQALVRRWNELGERFHGGDESVKASAVRMWDDHRSDLSERAGWPADEGAALVEYIRAVRATCG
jgi:DNA-binding transcriptional MerR regulator